jgi:hypothetical protein
VEQDAALSAVRMAASVRSLSLATVAGETKTTRRWV